MIGAKDWVEERLKDDLAPLRFVPHGHITPEHQRSVRILPGHGQDGVGATYNTY